MILPVPAPPHLPGATGYGFPISRRSSYTRSVTIIHVNGLTTIIRAIDSPD